MKITEQTTFAELQEYLRVCGDPFITLMAAAKRQPAWPVPKQTAANKQPRLMHAVVHVPNVGTFNGNGATAAEALEAAFTAFRLATLPDGLKHDRSPVDDLPPE